MWLLEACPLAASKTAVDPLLLAAGQQLEEKAAARVVVRVDATVAVREAATAVAVVASSSARGHRSPDNPCRADILHKQSQRPHRRKRCRVRIRDD